jgi:hypothetical protein
MRAGSRQKNLASEVFLRYHCDGLNFHDQLRPRQVTDFDKGNCRKPLLEDFLSKFVKLGNVAEIR